MINLHFSTDSCHANDLTEVIRAFYPHVIEGDDNPILKLSSNKDADTFSVKVDYMDETVFETYNLRSDLSQIEYKRLTKRYEKVCLYNALKKLTGVSLPYGALTGVRPTKLYRELTERGEDAGGIFKNLFDVSDTKASLVKSVCNNQIELLNVDDNFVDVYVNIPFCPSRCAYCSFVSVSIDKLQKYINDYVICVKNELSILKNIIIRNNYQVRAVYFGGGTPTSLPVNKLDELLAEIDFEYKEFTVEAGRPDTVNKAVLDTLLKRGVTRISINPQTLNDATLERIGRRHTVKEFYDAYELTRQYPFDINVDLIALLPDEQFGDFKRSVDGVIALAPDNVTVHTLSLKRGSVLTVSNYDNTEAETTKKMVDYAIAELLAAGYEPYYMYRQKYMSGGLENTGFAKSGKACLYNVDNMEESVSVMAAGSGAISKRLFPERGRLERLANVKDVKGYIERADSMANRIEDFWNT